MVDSCIAVGIALLTLVTAYLGVHLTMHPADTDKKKTVYKVAFGFCALGICVLIGIQTHRNSEAQQTLLGQMKDIQLHALAINAPPPVISPPVVTPDKKPSLTPHKPSPQSKPPVITQSSTGDCSPNIVGNNNSPTCVPTPKLVATQQLQQQMPDGDWLTSFSVSSNVLMQTGDLKLLCDGPVLRAGISRINPASFISGGNGPNPSNPNEAIYQLGPEMLSPGVPVVLGAYSHSPLHVKSGTLGKQVITIANQK
jgi:hypothetical protein